MRKDNHLNQEKQTIITTLEAAGRTARARAEAQRILMKDPSMIHTVIAAVEQLDYEGIAGLRHDLSELKQTLRRSKPTEHAEAVRVGLRRSNRISGPNAFHVHMGNKEVAAQQARRPRR